MGQRWESRDRDGNLRLDPRARIGAQVIVEGSDPTAAK